MKDSYHIFSDGCLKRKDNTISFVSDEDGVRRDIPIERVSDIYVMSEISLNVSLLNILSKYGVNVHFFNYYGHYIGSYYPKEKLISGNLHVRQAEHYSDPEKRLVLAQAFILAGAENIYRNLRYYNPRKNVGGYIDEIKFLISKINKTSSVDELMGIEGNIRKLYYESWNFIVNQKIDFVKRVKNPPDNMINSLISFVNSLMYARVLSEIYHTQLDPSISFLHEPGVRRFSLSLDVSEVFKPLLCDRLIFSLLNRNQITEKSFTKGLNCLHLTKDAQRLICQEFDKKMRTTIMHKELRRNISYQDLIRLDMYKLVKHLLGEKEYSGFTIWW